MIHIFILDQLSLLVHFSRTLIVTVLFPIKDVVQYSTVSFGRSEKMWGTNFTASVLIDEAVWGHHIVVSL